MYTFFKRFFDIILSGIAIIVLSPLLVPVMLILKCTGEHDIFYGQDRIGYKNKHFKILKFATIPYVTPNQNRPCPWCSHLNNWFDACHHCRALPTEGIQGGRQSGQARHLG
ncbi:MAG: sugar transferase [Kiritimatiellia bacterium]